MEQLFKWFKSHSDALQGIAALLIIIAAVATLPTLLISLTRPDIILRFSLNETTVPDDLRQWLKEFVHVFQLNEKMLIPGENVHQEFASILRNPVVKKIQESMRTPNQLTVAIINQTSRPTSGLRLRLDNVYTLWGVETEGDFLSPNEQRDIQNRIIEGYLDRKVIISSLPDIPPNSSLKILLYGDLEIAVPTLNVVGYSMVVRKIIEVEDS
jgi:hypothetical protein